LQVQILPDPAQTITLDYFVGEETPEKTDPTPEPTEEGQPTPELPKIEVSDVLRLRTSVIVDHNGHPVPDGTPIQFIFAYPQEGLEQTITATTRDGVAEASSTVDRTGQLDISVQADPAPRTVVLQITIQEGGETIIERITPTPTPTPVIPTPTPTMEPEPVIEPTVLPTEVPPTPEVVEEVVEPPADEQGDEALDIGLALVAAFAISAGGYYLARLNNASATVALRAALWCFVSGLVLYVGYVLRAPGTVWLRQQTGALAAGWVTLAGSLVALAVAWVLVRRVEPARGSESPPG
jgi:beta-N-acetylhexosaminidase